PKIISEIQEKKPPPPPPPLDVVPCGESSEDDQELEPESDADSHDDGDDDGDDDDDDDGGDNDSLAVPDVKLFTCSGLARLYETEVGGVSELFEVMELHPVSA